MATASGGFSEPRVLARAKECLFPDDDEVGSYAVTDTEFSTDEWLSGEGIAPAIHEQLAPFNHVRVGSGYPDLVGVRKLDPDLLAVERFGEEPPLIVLEAKEERWMGPSTRSAGSYRRTIDFTRRMRRTWQSPSKS